MAGVGSLSGTQQSVADGTSGIDATRFAGLAGRAVVNAGLSSAIYGTSFGDALKNSLINDVAAIGANTVGRSTDALTPQNVIYHAMVGAATAELRGEDPAAAALGAATAALINPLADDYTSATDETTRTAQHAAIATLMAGLVARAAGKDEGAAIGAAQNETFNNFLTQENIEEKYARLAGAQTVAERREILALMLAVSRENRNAAADGMELVSQQLVLGQEKTRLQTLLDGSNACTANPNCVADAQRSIAQVDQILAAPDIAERLVPYKLAAEVALGLLPVSSVLEAAVVGRGSVNGIAYNGITGPGPLGTKVASTFRSGTYTEFTTGEATTLYRVWGGKAGEIGPYWTRTPPSGPVQSIVDSALNPTWGNTATNVTKIQVPAGIKVYEGIAAPQGGLVGGGSQIFIPKVDPAWIVR